MTGSEVNTEPRWRSVIAASGSVETTSIFPSNSPDGTARKISLAYFARCPMGGTVMEEVAIAFELESFKVNVTEAAIARWIWRRRLGGVAVE